MLALPLDQESLRSILRRFRVQKAFIFGSYARGEQTPKSDLDIYIHCGPGTSLFDVFDLQTELEKASGIRVDVVTKINPHFAEYIEPDLREIKL